MPAIGDAWQDVWQDVWQSVWAGTGVGAAPEVSVSGNGNNIANGDATPSVTDHTDFGSIVQGFGTVQHTFTVFNTGTVDLNVSGLTVPTGFTLVDGLPLAILAGGSDDFIVRLDDAVAGVKSGTISFSNDDSDENPFTFAITGTVTAYSPGGGAPPASSGRRRFVKVPGPRVPFRLS